MANEIARLIFFFLPLIMHNMQLVSCRSRIQGTDYNVQEGSSSVELSLTGGDGGSTPPPPMSLPSTEPPPLEEIEDVGRFIVTQVGTMMCYRSWEADPTVDFHLCHVCFNKTADPEYDLSRDQHISRIEDCMHQHISGSDYNECLPLLKDPSIPNKPYDILIAEPPFTYPYRNFDRCAHGVTFRQETEKCVAETDTVTGVDAFLDKFACLMQNLVLDSKRFSDANLAELLSTVPQNDGKRS